jgi:hypothetical protein
MPEAPASIHTERCLQIHITSLQDAKAVVRSLQKVRDACIAFSCTAIELYVFAGLENESIVKDLSQNFRWCKTYRTITNVAPGNVLFSVPHFDEEAWNRNRSVVIQQAVKPSPKPIPTKRPPGRPRINVTPSRESVESRMVETHCD